MSDPIQVTIPDIGDFQSVDVIEILVVPGDLVRQEDPLVTLESDKATMDIPAPSAGVITEIRTAVGEQVSQGSVILLIDQSDKKNLQDSNPVTGRAVEETHAETLSSERHSPPLTLPPHTKLTDKALPHASPSVRSFARELGVDLTMIRGSGPKGRILKSDVQAFVKNQIISPIPQNARNLNQLEQLPEVDFSRWGPIQLCPLSRLQKKSGPRLSLSWNTVPHVTHHHEIDISDIEIFRESLKNDAEKKGLKATLLPFIMKAVASTLAEFPTFNSSLAPDQNNLILKKYFNLGYAVATPDGLVVPVIHNVNEKGIFQLALELKDKTERARIGDLKPDDVQGGCFTLSNLGGIGGRGFTPIVNIPEVAILGISQAQTLPKWNGKEFAPRLILPVDLSYDHRVIDGATAAHFLEYLKRQLEDARMMLL